MLKLVTLRDEYFCEQETFVACEKHLEKMRRSGYVETHECDQDLQCEFCLDNPER